MGREETKQQHADDIKNIISATIKELHANEAQVQFKKPTTIQGWFYICLAFCSIVGLTWSSIIFLNNVATHSKIPYHHGTEDLVSKLHEDHLKHATSEDLHHREEQLELKIVEQVKPIKEILRVIQINQANQQAQQHYFKEDVKSVKEDIKEVQKSINRIADKLNQ